MVDQDFRNRYLTDPVISQVINTLSGMMGRCELSSHDLARCAVLAAEMHAMRCNGPITVVLRHEENVTGPREYIVTEEQLVRLMERARTQKSPAT